jgi:hypothetical protein
MTSVSHTAGRAEGGVAHVPDAAAHLSTDELPRDLGGTAPAVRAADALAALQRAGLAHRAGDFAWPTRAAVRCCELLP